MGRKSQSHLELAVEESPRFLPFIKAGEVGGERLKEFVLVDVQVEGRSGTDRPVTIIIMVTVGIDITAIAVHLRQGKG